MTGNIVIICKGGCGKTTDEVTPDDFWKGIVQPVEGGMVPDWTCKECKEVKRIDESRDSLYRKYGIK